MHMLTSVPGLMLASFILLFAPPLAVRPAFTKAVGISSASDKAGCQHLTTDNPVLVAANGDSGSRAIAALLHEAGVFMATGGVKCLREKKLPREACFPSTDMTDADCSDAHWDYHLTWQFQVHDLMPGGTVCYPPDELHKHEGAIRALQRDVSGVIQRYQRCGCPANATGNRFGLKHSGGMVSLPFFRKAYPRTSVVHLVRDGRDMAVGEKSEAIRSRLAGVLVGSGDLTHLPDDQLTQPDATLTSLRQLFCHSPALGGHPSCGSCLLQCATRFVSARPSGGSAGKKGSRRLLRYSGLGKGAAEPCNSTGHEDAGQPGGHEDVDQHGDIGAPGRPESGRRLLVKAAKGQSEHEGPLGHSGFIHCIASCSKFGEPREPRSTDWDRDGKDKGGTTLSYESNVDLAHAIPGGRQGLALAASAKVWGVLNMQFADCAGTYDMGPEDYILIHAEDFISRSSRRGVITNVLHRLGLPPPGAANQASMEHLMGLFERGVGDLPELQGKQLALKDHYGKWRTSVAADLIEIAAWPALVRFDYDLSMPVLADR
eukprot:jgi/Mesvir1/24373/Mv11044-RA.1